MIPTVAADEHNLHETESTIMQCYPESVSIRAGELLQLGVEPPTRLGMSRRFKLAIFRQGARESLEPLDLPIVERIRFVTRQGAIFSAAPLFGQRTPDIDWRWPRISLRIPATWPSGVYFVA